MPVEFVDTNILVYAYDQTAGQKYRLARELMERLWDSGEGMLSTQVLQEFHVAVTSRIPQPIPPRRAREIISDLGTWTIAVVEVSDILQASELGEPLSSKLLGRVDPGCRPEGGRRGHLVRGL